MKDITFSNEPIDKEKIIDELFQDPYLKQFFMSNDLTSKMIEENLLQLLTFKTEFDKCKNCKGLFECKQITTGFQPQLEFVNGRIKTYYQNCDYMEEETKLRQRKSRIDALYMPRMIEEADISDYKLNSEGRNNVYKYMMHFLQHQKMKQDVLGMYIWGEYNSGKTYSLAALANEVIKQGNNVIIAYYPDLVRECKSSIGNQSLEPLISKLKRVDVLMLDDIGGENQSAWVRDEVLGPILQHRLLDHKPTMFSSNVSLQELAKYFTVNNSKQEKMKAYRIMTRIKTLTKNNEFKL